MLIPYSLKGHRKEFITEEYVVSPPALFIYDEKGNNFSLGLRYREFKDRDRVNGHLTFNVLFNGFETGEYASHIEKRKGRISILTSNGRKHWNGRSFI